MNDKLHYRNEFTTMNLPTMNFSGTSILYALLGVCIVMCEMLADNDPYVIML